MWGRSEPTAPEFARSHHRTWTVFTIALCSLLGLTLFPGLIALNRSQRIYNEIRGMQENYERSQLLLEKITGNVFLTSILVREFLLDSAEDAGTRYRARLAANRGELHAAIEELRRMMRPDEMSKFDRLKAEVDGYLGSIAPILNWSPRQRALRGTYFLREEQRPTRQSVLAVASEIERIDTTLYRQQSERVNASETEYRHDLRRAMWLAVLAGVIIATASILRIAVLERRSQLHFERAERTGQELRHLSARLRQAQEEERKGISRELHDEVGQKLTALRMGLGGLERLRAGADREFRSHVDEMKGLAEQSLKTIRDIAVGLRPSVLDDLGLGPALQMQARGFSRHTGIRVAIELHGDLDGLSEGQRICIYRVVQESLTNCARHARAERIEVAVRGDDKGVDLTVSDNGTGFDPKRVASPGLGLIGIEERVRELGGTLHIDTAPGKGTRLRVHLDRNGKSL